MTMDPARVTVFGLIAVSVASAILLSSPNKNECFHSKYGVAYNGKLNVTSTGKTCQRWGTQSPHVHKYGSLWTEENYCRNPDANASGPWCYTTDTNTVRETCGMSQCNETFDPCSSSPCQNGGTCRTRKLQTNILSYSCTCKEGWRGSTCQNRVPWSSCNSSPCMNGGTCVEKQYSFSCRCLKGFIGDTCSISLSTDLCDSPKYWRHIGKSCYKVYDTLETWDDALNRCNFDDSDLVVITDYTIQQAVSNLSASVQADLWTGIRSHQGTWVDTKYEKLSLPKKYWKIGASLQPINNTCVAVSSTDNDKSNWMTADCQKGNYFVCSKPEGACPSGWIFHQRRCYMLVNDMVSSWYRAQQHCRGINSQLLDIHSKNEQIFVQTFIQQQSARVGVSPNKIWLNLRMNALNKWTWDSTGQEPVYQNWNDSTSQLDHECAYLDTGRSGQWFFDTPCSSSLMSICVMDVNSENWMTAMKYAEKVKNESETVISECGDGWIDDPNGDSCYKIQYDEFSWTEAESNCQKQNAHLISINSPREQAFISGNLYKNDRISSVWIGANSRTEKMGWKWSDDSPFAYYNWIPGQPDGLEGGTQECVTLFSNLLQWADNSCGQKHASLCERTRPSRNQSLTTPASTTTKGNMSCPEGWKGYLGNCFLVVRQKFSWTAASEYCRNIGGRLASLSDQNEQNFVYSQLPKDFCYNLHENDTHCAQLAASGQCSSKPIYMAKYCHSSCNLCIKNCSDVHDTQMCQSWANSPGCQANAAWMLKNCAQSCGACDSATKGGFWLGLKDSGDKTFDWADGSDVTYTPWRQGEPQGFSSYKQGCTLMTLADGLWFDESCNSLMPGFICKAPKSEIGIATLPASRIGCKSNSIGYNSYCYTFHDTEKTWSDAAKQCESDKGHLATVNSRYVQAFLSSQLVGKTGKYWIGYQESQSNETVVWHNGETVDFRFAEQLKMVYSPQPDVNCKTSVLGKSYRGKLSTTVSGRTCQRWDRKVPHNHTRGAMFTESASSHVNYCRNPDNEPGGPWCYTMDPNKRWEYCDIQPCECKIRKDGKNYVGKKSRTSSGKLCQRWNRQYPHKHEARKWFKNNILPSHNYCRNPKPGNHSLLPWCYTVDYSTRWEYCDIPMCKDLNAKTCIYMQTAIPGIWSYTNCSSSAKFICESLREGYTTTVKTTTIITTPRPTCMSGWIERNSYCYKMFQDKLPWTEARRACREMGADLLSIGSYSEWNFVRDRFKWQMRGDTWIGFNDRDKEGDWKWSDGSSAIYRRWNSGQPDDYYNNEDCGVLKRYSLYYNDLPCFNRQGFLCKGIKGVQNENNYKPMKLESCDTKGFVHFNESCYYVGPNQAVTYHQAKKKCEEKGANLASIHSIEEMNFVINIGSVIDSQKWIGLDMLNPQKKWRWLDGSPLDFTLWARNEPNDHQGQEKCVEMNRYNGRWNDATCGRTFYSYICKRSNSSTTPSPTTGAPLIKGGCPKDFLPSPISNKCYYIGNVKVTWETARTECKTKGHSLLSIRDQVEQDFVTSLLIDAKIKMWIGINKLSAPTYQWEDNTEVTFTNWQTGQPSSYYKKCGLMNVVNQEKGIGRWESENCGWKKSYICQAYKDASKTDTTKSDCSSKYPGYVQYSRSCFKLFKTLPLDRDSAQNQCSLDGGNLASIGSEYESGFVKTFALQQNVSNFWIGLKKTEDFTLYAWEDGIPYIYVNWKDGEPTQRPNENCVISHNSKWDDYHCNVRQPYLCEINLDPLKAPPEPVSCHNDSLPFNGACYYVELKEKTSWGTASRNCKKYGMELASFHSNIEALHILQFARRKGMPSTQKIWIGLTRLRDLKPFGTGGEWYWSDGSDVDYINWNTGEPNDSLLSTTEQCVETYFTGRWNDAACHLNQGFICKQSVFSTSTVAMTTAEPANTTLPRVNDTVVDMTTVTPIPRATQKQTQNTEDSGVPVLAVIGAVIGILVVCIAVSSLAYIIYKKSKHVQLQDEASPGFENALYQKDSGNIIIPDSNFN